jgi:hypothetical protein
MVFSILSFLFEPCTLNADPTPISSIEDFWNVIKAKREAGIEAKDICVVLDFHGFLTNQHFQEDFMTFRPKAKECIEYLKHENISFVIATGWNKFDEVIKSPVLKPIKETLGINTEQKTPLREFMLGNGKENKVEGYVNGCFVALRYHRSMAKVLLEQNITINETFFFQKAFAPEVVFGERQFTHMLFGDDNPGNHKIFEKDLPRTIHGVHTVVEQYLMEDPPLPPKMEVSVGFSHVGNITPCTLWNSSGESSPIKIPGMDSPEDFNSELTKKLESIQNSNVDPDKRDLVYSRSGSPSLNSSCDDLKESQ